MGYSQMPQVGIEEADFGGNTIQHLTKAEGITIETIYTVLLCSLIPYYYARGVVTAQASQAMA